MNDAAQGIKALSHIRRIRVGIKRIGIAECEHRLIKIHQLIQNNSVTLSLVFSIMISFYVCN